MLAAERLLAGLGHRHSPCRQLAADNRESEMVVTLFRSRLTAQAGDDYSVMSAEMLDRARTYPGFVAMKSFKADDGERLTVVWWETDELQTAWRQDERHREAQKKGRERWYHYYHLEVAQVLREHQFVKV
jgi:heme-degrading monooxygenase HmoA